MSLLELLPLALLGAVLGLDSVSFPQAMISRPVVAATAAGALLGEPVDGLMIGATLEFFAIETLPFGASRYPEWGPAGVVGAALYAVHSEQPGALLMGVVGALLVAWVGGWSMVQLRKLNARWRRDRHDEFVAGSRRAVIGMQLRGLNADLLRGALLTFLALAVLAPLQRLALAQWGSDNRLSRAVVAGAAISVGAGAVWKVFHATPGARWLFVAALAVGLIILFRP